MTWEMRKEKQVRDHDLMRMARRGRSRALGRLSLKDSSPLADLLTCFIAYSQPRPLFLLCSLLTLCLFSILVLYRSSLLSLSPQPPPPSRHRHPYSCRSFILSCHSVYDHRRVAKSVAGLSHSRAL